MNTHETLFAYSEWLDGQGIILSERDSGDDRSHTELARDFIRQWRGEPLAGTEAKRKAGVW